MAEARERSVGIREGDLFAIPAPDGRFGYGQVVVGVTVFYVAIFRDLYNEPPDLDQLVKGELLLVGWTLDALIYHGRWKIVGNRPPISARVPFPSYKVRVEGVPHVRNFSGQHYRLATNEDWELLENKTTVAPIRYQNALLAYHGFGEFRSDYEALTIEHARRRIR
ncbi:MAG: Imm26 family immunity protein [Steroidobacteraceae bacterium]